MKVLVAYDGSEYSRSAITDLVNAGIDPDAEITVIAVAESSSMVASSIGQNMGMGEIPYTGELLTQVIQDEISHTNALLAESVASVRAVLPSAKVDFVAALGQPAMEILEQLNARPYDLVVLGSHGRGALARVFLGSVSLQVLHAARCSVRIVRHSNGAHHPLRILIAVDGSNYSDTMLERISRYNWQVRPLVTLIYVDDLALIASVHGFGVEMVSSDTGKLGQSILDSAVQQLGELGRDARTVCKIGNPVTSIINEAIHEGSHTIYLGAQGHKTFERLFLGSVSHGVASKFKGSVEVIR
ncbi:MAG TPA: universal stress protein [Candidatus Kapabacteria bacterium]|nr:universal stress protein [Candidatus Kapabacteria bacterium]